MKLERLWMRNKIIILVIFIAVLVSLILSLKRGETLIKPDLTPAPTATFKPPQEIKYDSSTDLKNELDSVNPEVFDSDFN